MASSLGRIRLLFGYTEKLRESSRNSSGFTLNAECPYSCPLTVLKAFHFTNGKVLNFLFNPPPPKKKNSFEIARKSGEHWSWSSLES